MTSAAGRQRGRERGDVKRRYIELLREYDVHRDPLDVSAFVGEAAFG
ncbi:hypothetical protein [Plantibacter sp. YIM 135347]